jgi:2'-5' RNA ligase
LNTSSWEADGWTAKPLGKRRAIGGLRINVERWTLAFFIMHKRLFASIDMPPSVEEMLVNLDPRIPGVRWSIGNQMHITLGFFGSVSDEDDLALHEKVGAIQFRPFFLPIVGIGTFPAKGQVKVIWIGIGNGHPHLFQIHKRVQEAALAAGCEPDLRPWHPHITLAHCRGVPAGGALPKFLKVNADFDAGLIRVDSFHLYCSELTLAGPIHTRELTINCSGGL